MELPETIRKRLDDFSRNILFDQTRTVTFAEENDGFLPHGKPKTMRLNFADELAQMLALV